MKPKRIVMRPWGTRRKGGWVIQLESLIEALKRAEVAEFEGIQVGTKNLLKLLRLMPGEYSLVSTNGNLSIETIQMVFRKQKDGNRKAGYRRPKHYYHSFTLFNEAWVPIYSVYNTVVIKPRKF